MAKFGFRCAWQVVIASGCLIALPLFGDDSWRSIGPEGGGFREIARSASNPLVLYAGSGAGAVYKSTDGGQNWIDVTSDTVAIGQVSAIAVDPSNPDIVFASATRSTDGGASWEFIGDDLWVGGVMCPQERYAINPQDSSIVYLGQNCFEGVWKSTDGGTSWTRIIVSSAGGGYTLDIDPVDPDNVYVATPSNGVFRTTDAGMTWQAPATWPGGTFITRIVVDPLTPSTVYVRTDQGLRRSLNSGIDWEAFSTSSRAFEDLAIDPVMSSTLYGTDYRSGFFKSADGGVTWSAIGTGTSTELAITVLVDPVTPTTLFLGLNGREGVAKSTDSGATWTTANKGLRGHSVQSMAVDPTDGSNLYAGAFDGGVYRSTDGGETWSLGSGLTSSFFFGIVVDRVSPATVYAAGSGTVYKSTDHGANWIPTAGSFSFLYALAISPSVPSTLYAGGFSDFSIARSSDGGDSWTVINNGLSGTYVYDIAVDPLAAANVYAATSDGAYKSSDSGDSWTPLSVGPGGNSVYSMDIDPIAPAIVYAGANDAVYKSSDGGDSWTLLPGSPGLNYLSFLRLAPSDPEVIYVTNGSVYRSFDGGASWSEHVAGLSVNGGLRTVGTVSLAIDPEDPLRAWVGTAGAGVFTNAPVTGSCTAQRAVPPGYVPEQPATITVDVAPDATVQVYAVEETPPAGWPVSAIDHGGVFDSVTETVKWGPFFDSQARSLHYSVTPPVGTTGSWTLAGIISLDGTSEPTCGDTQLDPAILHPADLDDDWHLRIDEVTAYGAAWKTGAVWPRPPNPIPIDYVTNAGFLWKVGEIYHFDTAQDPPWVPGAAASSPLLETGATLTAGAGNSAISSFDPLHYTPGEAVEVTILVALDVSTNVYALEDRPPAGWTVSDISHGGSFDTANGLVKWGPYFDNEDRALVYRATPPMGETDPLNFLGQASFDGTSVPIAGARTIHSVDSIIFADGFESGDTSNWTSQGGP